MASWTSIGAADVEDAVRFNRDIRPILSDKCFHCHGPDEKHRAADLRFDTEEGAKADRDGEPAVVPGKPDESALIERITTDSSRRRMPPRKSGKTLSDTEIATLRRWIEEGASYEDHWSFVPLRRPATPTPRDTQWARNEVDLFVLARLERAGLRPSAEADRVTLARRLWLDLTGLPPRPADVARFLEEPSDAAYEALVEELLASPHYGERMAVYWLDLVRYADTVGYHGDQEHNASPYRDWVIHAFNSNMPFDRFTTEQIAGDLLPEAGDDQRIATAYNRLLQTTHEGGAQDAEYLAKYAADRVRNLSGAWLGATMGCAECHDHKYDPYTQRDFYSLVAFFADVEEQGAYNSPNSSPTTRPPEIEVLSPIDREEITAIDEELAELRAESSSLAGGSPRREEIAGEVEALQAEREALSKRLRKVMITKSRQPREIRLLARGDWMDDTGPVVSPAAPHFLPGAPASTDERRLTRLDLAAWLTAPENPQTARVFVNRVWYLLFGRGIARSLDDLGSQGQWPTHPDLLDWLAVEFLESGWDVKDLVRRIVLSRTYRQSSSVTAELATKDPRNDLFSRQGRFRLPAEFIRDTTLAVSGLLVDRLGGRSVRPYQPKGYYAHLNFPPRKYQEDEGESLWRRGVYTHWQRQFLHPMLRAFDAPTREECTAERPISNTPSAALTLLNDPAFVEAARAFAERLVRSNAQSDEARLVQAWREALTRSPTGEEIEVLRALLTAEREAYRSAPEAAEQVTGIGEAPRAEGLDRVEVAAWTAVARALLNLDELITRY